MTREHGAALWWVTSWSEQRGMAMWEGARKIVSRRREKIDPLFDCLNAAFPELGLDRAILTHNWAGPEDSCSRARAPQNRRHEGAKGKAADSDTQVTKY